MCGLTGIILGRKRRTDKQFDNIEELFERLLILSEHRGRYATGAAWIREDGSFAVAKAPLSARSFVESEDYEGWRRGINVQTAILMGHTRYPTQGSHLVNANNQPLASSESRPVVLTHNGHIPNVGRLFKRFRLSRQLEVDSEIILKLAVRRLGPTGLGFHRLIADLQSCPGLMAVVLATPNNPDEVLFIRREQPLVLAFHRRLRMLAYASELPILEEALRDWPGWRIKSLPPFRGLLVDRTDLDCLSTFPLSNSRL